MRHNPEVFDEEVRPALEDLEGRLLSLQHEFDAFERTGREDDEDLSYEIGHALAAAEALVSAIEAWIPALVPSPRGLDEVLESIASWQRSELTDRTATMAVEIVTQLQADDYKGHAYPESLPDLDKFVEDLGDTLERVKQALS